MAAGPLWSCPPSFRIIITSAANGNDAVLSVDEQFPVAPTINDVVTIETHAMMAADMTITSDIVVCSPGKGSPGSGVDVPNS